MQGRFPSPFKGSEKELGSAARDLAFLLDRGYPTQAGLKLVGDRYQLKASQRELLLRAVVPRPRAQARRRKKVRALELKGRWVTVDGYNVLATLEHALRGYPMVLARDGFVRDAVKAGPRVKIEHLDRLWPCWARFFKRYRPRFLGLYLDAPVSGSGLLAARLRAFFKKEGLPGEALAIPEAERRVLEGEIVCTADGALLDQAEKVFDLAGFLLRYYLKLPLIRLFKG